MRNLDKDIFECRTWNVLESLHTDVLYKDLTKQYMRLSRSLILHRGKRNATKVLKDIGSKAKLLAIQDKVKKGDYAGLWLKLSSNGFPTKLHSFSKIVETRNVDLIRCGLQVFNFVETIILPPEVKTSEIMRLYGGCTKALKHFQFAIWQVANRDLSRITVNMRKLKKYHLGTRGGPQGAPNIIKSGQNPYPILFGIHSADIQWCMKVLGRGELINLAKSTWQAFEFPIPRDQSALALARLICFSEKAGKTRQVYAPSWYIQESLYEIHQIVYKILGQLGSCDGTYSHAKSGEKVKEWTKEGRKIWSFDLSSATDRFPLELQKGLIASLFSIEIAEAWATLAKIPAIVPELKGHVRWQTGQPMGIFSSWPVFALTHHMLLRSLSSSDITDKYIIVGDDIVISDEDLAMKYKRTLSKLDIPINESKSVLHENSSGSAAEFVKRIFRDGVEYSPISSRILKEIFDKGQYYLCLTLFQEFQLKWDMIVDSIDGHARVAHFPANLFGHIPEAYFHRLVVVLTSPEALIMNSPGISKCLHVGGTLAGISLVDKWYGISKDNYTFNKMIFESSETTQFMGAITSLSESVRHQIENHSKRGLKTSPAFVLHKQRDSTEVPMSNLAEERRLNIANQPFWIAIKDLERKLSHIINDYNQGEKVCRGDLGYDLDELLKVFNSGNMFSYRKTYNTEVKDFYDKILTIHRNCL